MDDHEKAEEDNVNCDDHDDISTGLFVLWIVRIKTTRIKMKRTGMIMCRMGMIMRRKMWRILLMLLMMVGWQGGYKLQLFHFIL